MQGDDDDKPLSELDATKIWLSTLMSVGEQETINRMRLRIIGLQGHEDCCALPPLESKPCVP